MGMTTSGNAFFNNIGSKLLGQLFLSIQISIPESFIYGDQHHCQDIGLNMLLMTIT